MQLAPSLLSANFANLEKDLAMINDSEADFLHVDIMDGHFVDNISFGYPIVEILPSLCRKPLDVHLMVEEPERQLDMLKKAGVSIITVHYEACQDLSRVLKRIVDMGIRPGVALNPPTPVEAIEDVLDLVEVVLVMSVNPGLGGQDFLESTIGKVERLAKMTQALEKSPVIEVDGGVNLENAKRLLRAGASMLVSGSFVLCAPDPVGLIKKFKSL